MVPRLQGLGHEVAVSAFCGLFQTRTSWNGITVYPGGLNGYGNDVIEGHAADFKADLVLTLMDMCMLDPQAMARLGAAHWMPVDCSPLSALDAARLKESGASAIAISEFGRDMLANAGFAPYYLPHGIETTVFAPGDKALAREKMGLPQDAFVIGMNAANSDDKDRKGFWEQLSAFAILRSGHKDVILLMHSVAAGPGQDLNAMCEFLQIGEPGIVRWSDRHKMAAGGFTQADMAVWYSALDLYSGAAHAEGFGLPLLEAAACGIPVVATDASAMTEVAGPAGWLVQGEPRWHREHGSQWCKPHIGELAQVYREAHAGAVHADGLSEKVRAHAMNYDADALMPEWDRLLKLLEAERD